MSIIESDGPPSWFLDASETGERVQNTLGWGWWRAQQAFISPTHGRFVLSQVSLASRDQDGGPSDSTIHIYDLTEKIGDCEQ